jgi:hypothetical protein
MSEWGGQWKTMAKAIDDNMNEIDHFVEQGVKDYQELKQALAIERAINRELQKQIGQLTCRKTF